MIYIILGIVVLVGAGLYVSTDFSAQKPQKNSEPIKNYQISYGEVFSDPKEGSEISFPDFILKFKGVSEPSIIERLSFKKFEGLDGPILTGYFNFDLPPLPQESTFKSKKIIIKDVPWGFDEFVVGGKTYTIQIIYSSDDNPKLPKFMVTEGDIETARVFLQDRDDSSNFAGLYYIDLDVGKKKYPDREFFRPSAEDTDGVLQVLAIELKKYGYTQANKRSIQIIGYMEDNKKKVYAFMWVNGGPLDRRNPEKNYLTNMIMDGGSSYIDATVSIDPMSDVYSIFVTSFAPHGES